MNDDRAERHRAARWIGAVIALILALTLAAPAGAVRPVRGCSDNFDPWEIAVFRGYLNSQEFLDSLSPEGQALAEDILASVNSGSWLAAVGAYDKNGDGVLCIKQNPPTKGNLYGWIFNAVDNAANH